MSAQLIHLYGTDKAKARMARAATAEGLTADEAAWALIADAAERGLMLPGLTASGASKLARVMIAGDQASRRPPRPLPLKDGDS